MVERTGNTFFKKIVSPLLERVDSETWHVRAREALHLTESIPLGTWTLERLFAFRDPRLHVEVMGILFDNPVLVAAGWDKVGHAVEGLHALGFGGVEVGSVLQNPQEGNPKPREFIIADGIAINRMGFNSPGMKIVADNLKRYEGRNIPIGISVGKNKEVSEEDAPKAHGRVVDVLYEFGDYFVINVSSPNTPGLRDLQAKKPLTDIIHEVQKAMDKHGARKPLFVKTSPDLTNEEIYGILDVIEATGVDGIIPYNTSLNTAIKGRYYIKDSRLPLVDEKGRRRTWADEAGGISGDDPDYRKRATDIVRYIYQEITRRKLNIIIIGAGGIKDAKTALEKIKAGATLVQVLTAIRGEGPAVAGNINRGIVVEMRRLGITDFRDLVGYDVRHKKK